MVSGRLAVPFVKSLSALSLISLSSRSQSGEVVHQRSPPAATLTARSSGGGGGGRGAARGTPTDRGPAPPGRPPPAATLAERRRRSAGRGRHRDRLRVLLLVRRSDGEPAAGREEHSGSNETFLEVFLGSGVRVGVRRLPVDWVDRLALDSLASFGVAVIRLFDGLPAGELPVSELCPGEPSWYFFRSSCSARLREVSGVVEARPSVEFTAVVFEVGVVAVAAGTVDEAVGVETAVVVVAVVMLEGLRTAVLLGEAASVVLTTSVVAMVEVTAALSVGLIAGSVTPGRTASTWCHSSTGSAV